MKKPRTARAEIERLRTELEESVRLHFAAHQRMERAEAERDALRADAERYRWLRQWAGRSEEFPSDLSDPTNPEEMDAAIDAAMQRGKEQGNANPDR